jgi:hypothetical protein
MLENANRASLKKISAPDFDHSIGSQSLIEAPDDEKISESQQQLFSGF